MIAFHPFANIFPLLENTDLGDLAKDIAAYGLREKVKLLDGQILDGRNRYRAAISARVLNGDDGAEDHPAFFERFVRELDGDPLAYVISRNLKRRHLNESQRAFVAAKLATLQQGRPPEKSANLRDLKPSTTPITQPSAALTLNVSERLVQHAAVVRREGTPELQRAVEQGHLAVSAAAQATKLGADTQREIATAAEAGRANVVRTVIKQEVRAKRERMTGLAMPEGLFGVIVEDFEWDYEVYSRETGMDRHAANHYETADSAHTPEEIVERTRDRFACAAPDCVLFMWAPAPHLVIATDVMRLRGFKYVSNAVWRKDRIVTGHWFRFRHEHLLVGTKGSVPCPAPGKQWESVIDQPLGEHSAKPEAILELVEQYFPTWRKIELNCRGAGREGWAVWGNEAAR